MVTLALQQRLSQYVLCPEPHPAPRKDIARYFGPRRFPGTISVGARKDHPDIFQDTLDSAYETYPRWLARTVASALNVFVNGQKPSCPSPDKREIRNTVRTVAAVLEFQTADRIPLCEAVPQQMYEDVFMRILSLFIRRHGPARQLHPYREFNALCHRIGLLLIDRMERQGITDARHPDINRLVQVAVLSGYVGINLKSSASAASDLLNWNLVPIRSEWTADMETVRAIPAETLMPVAEKLTSLCEAPEGQFGLDSLALYQTEVTDVVKPTLLVFFCDDYMESLIDMKRFEVMLARNPHLKLLFVPRAGRYGNDLSVEDLPAVLRERQFKPFRRLYRAGRIRISINGPRAGCLDPGNVSARLIREIDTLGADRAIVFETKGCRNFEMLRGRLQVPWYASFNCNRALSIRTVRIDGPPVFLRIPPGLSAYEGFARPRIAYSRSYPTAKVRFAHMTTRQMYAALDTRIYGQLRRRVGDELLLNTTLTHLGKIFKMTFSELTDVLSDGPAGKRFQSFTRQCVKNHELISQANRLPLRDILRECNGNS
ncbi:hypothetical protein DENIS_0649 [Desulfonema ishimotonii]|uniref:Uncharacterized protein n=1 Tax=Desulfonema ishimotonii TaxID=45657 RepID=A0A401FRX3_9BACT|nr:hypothetical protein [Desulfonema ishimotonii]GBC59708.1 hypothetical protein DENIS_0649 [Desulfonema ishimotonii]